MSLSADFIEAATAQSTDEILLHFLDFYHPDIGTTLRFVNNREDVTRGGNTYTGYNFEVELPEDMPNTMPYCTLTIDNIDRAMVNQIRTLSGLKQIEVTVNEARYATPDTTERGPYEFLLYDVDYNRIEIKGRMSFEDFMNDKFPKDRKTAQNQPGLYG